MHYHQLPSFLRLFVLSTLVLPSFAVEDCEVIDTQFTVRYVDPLTVKQATITLNYHTALNVPPNTLPTEFDVPLNSLYQPPNVQASIIAVSAKTLVRGKNDVGAPINLGPQEIWCQCFADKTGQKALVDLFTFSPAMPLGSGPTPIGSIFCSDQRGLRKHLRELRTYLAKVAADNVLGGPDVKEGLDKVQGGSPKKSRRFFSS